MKDQVFMLPLDGEPSWKVAQGSRIVRAEWNSKGAALAGLAVEQRRAVARAKKEQSSA